LDAAVVKIIVMRENGLVMKGNTICQNEYIKWLYFGQKINNEAALWQPHYL